MYFVPFISYHSTPNLQNSVFKKETNKFGAPLTINEMNDLGLVARNSCTNNSWVSALLLILGLQLKSADNSQVAQDRDSGQQACLVWKICPVGITGAVAPNSFQISTLNLFYLLSNCELYICKFSTSPPHLLLLHLLFKIIAYFSTMKTCKKKLYLKSA